MIKISRVSLPVSLALVGMIQSCGIEKSNLSDSSAASLSTTCASGTNVFTDSSDGVANFRDANKKDASGQPFLLRGLSNGTKGVCRANAGNLALVTLLEEGFIHKSLLKVKSTGVFLGTKACVPGTALLVSSNDGANFRSLTDPENTVLRVLPDGMEVECRGDNSATNRSRVSERGLIARSLLTLEGTTPVPTPIPTQPPASSNKLDTNDVSFLFPLRDAQLLKVTSQGTAGVLFPKTIFDKVVAAGRTTAQITFDDSTADPKNINNWRVVSFRFDPCFPKLNPASGCELELRIVAQPFSAGDTSDMTAHLIYHPAFSERTAIANELLVLKQASPVNTSGPLGTHPGLNQNNAAYTKLVHDFILKRMGASNLAQVAFMGTRGGDPWVFFAGSVSGSNYNLFSITNTGGARAESTFAENSVTPRPSGDSTADLLGGAAFTQPRADAIARLENPAIHSQGSADCVSCHTASRMVERNRPASDSLMNASTFRFKAPAGINGTVAPGHLTNLLYSVRNFGYFFTTPQISQRTANESAAVADFTNKNVLLVP